MLTVTKRERRRQKKKFVKSLNLSHGFARELKACANWRRDKKERIARYSRNPVRLTPEQEAAWNRETAFRNHYLYGSGGRWGGTPTRSQNDFLARVFEANGYKVIYGAGRGPEEYIPPEGGGTKGGTYVDITVTKDGKTIRIQTVSTLADGKTATPNEQAAAARIKKAFPNDQLILIAKEPKR